MDILKKDIIQVEDYNSFISKKGLVIRLEIAGGRNSYRVTPKIFGVKNDKLTDESREFLGEHVKNGRVNFVPKYLYNKLNTKATTVKQKLESISIGYNNSFVPIGAFEEFEEVFNKNKKEYMQDKEDIIANFQHLRSRFIEIARETLVDLNAQDAQAEISEIISKLPTLEEFENSFIFEMHISAFPNTANLELFDEDLRDRLASNIQKADGDMMKSSIVSSLNEGVDALLAVLNSNINRATIHHNVIKGIQNNLKRMKSKNIFSNTKIEEYIQQIDFMASLDMQEAIAEAEIILSSIYFYATELEIETDIDLAKSPITGENLLAIYEMYN